MEHPALRRVGVVRRCSVKECDFNEQASDDELTCNGSDIFRTKSSDTMNTMFGGFAAVTAAAAMVASIAHMALCMGEQ